MWHTHPHTRRCVFDRSHFLKNSQTKTHFVTQALVQLWLLQTVEAAVQLSEKLQGHIVNACLFNYTLSLYGHLKGSVDHSTFTQTLTMDFLLCSPPPPATVSVLPPPIGCLSSGWCNIVDLARQVFRPAHAHGCSPVHPFIVFACGCREDDAIMQVAFYCFCSFSYIATHSCPDLLSDFVKMKALWLSKSPLCTV